MTEDDSLPASPVLRDECELTFDESRQEHLLLYPEGAISLNETGYEILDRLDEQKSIDSLVNELESDFNEDDLAGQVRSFLRNINEQNVLTDG